MTAAQSIDVLIAALHGRRSGRGWSARCPVHNDRHASLSLGVGDNGKVLVICHAGCDGRDVIAELRRRGLWSDHVDTRPPPAADNTKLAAALWRECTPPQATPVESYLASRGLRLPATGTLRYHHCLQHPAGTWPAMVALVQQADGRATAVHRTFLKHDGTGKAPVEPNKMALGSCRGGAVRLGEATNSVILAEGIETALACQQMAGRPAWATLGVSGMLKARLPDSISTVMIAADRDDAGISAAKSLRAMLSIEGRSARVIVPDGKDFNDDLISGARS